MSGVNKAILVGRLGQDPEIRTTQGGAVVCNFSLATDRQWKDKAGQLQKETQWHRVVVWGKTAEACEKYLAKGRQVYVEGRLQTREYEGKDGSKRSVTEVVADVVRFLGGKGDGGGTGSERGGGGGGPRDQDPMPASDAPDDEIHF